MVMTVWCGKVENSKDLDYIAEKEIIVIIIIIIFAWIEFENNKTIPTTRRLHRIRSFSSLNN